MQEYAAHKHNIKKRAQQWLMVDVTCAVWSHGTCKQWHAALYVNTQESGYSSCSFKYIFLLVLNGMFFTVHT